MGYNFCMLGVMGWDEISVMHHTSQKTLWSISVSLLMVY